MKIDWKTSILNGILWGIVLLLATNYVWWKAFYMGADASLCAMEQAQLGAEEAMKAPSCKRIEGKHPPVDIFGLREE